MSVVLSDHLPLLASAPDGIQKLRGLILELAVRGKLVPQDPDDESASELLKRIAKERAQQEANGTGKKSKPTPAVSKDEQAFELPDGWAWVRFADVTSYIQRGKGPDYGDKSEYVVVSQKCVRWHGLDLSQARWITPESFSKYDTIRLLRGGDVLWNSTGTGTIGRAVVVPSLEAGQVLVADSHVTVVRSVLMSPIYLWRWIQSPSVQREIEGSASGSTNQIELATSTVTAHPLPLPPLAEQHRIVAKVDELMALCDRLEAEQVDAASAHARLVETLLGTLTQSTDAADLATNWQRLAEHFDTLFSTDASIDALKQTVLQLAVMGKLVPQESRDEPVTKLLARIAEARRDTEGTAKKRTRAPISVDVTPPFKVPGGWAWRRLDELLTISSGITLGKNYQDRTLVSRPYLRVANVQRGYLALEQIKTIEIPVEDVDRYRLRSRDLLITEGGDWDKVGRTAIWSEEIEDCLHQNHVFRARPLSSEWNVRWTEMFLNSVPARTYFAGASKQTTNLASINMTQLKACAFPVPPLAEQHRIVAKVDELMALCDRLKTDLATARQHEATLADTLIETAQEAA